MLEIDENRRYKEWGFYVGSIPISPAVHFIFLLLSIGFIGFFWVWGVGVRV